MGKKIDEIISKLPKSRQKSIQARAAELIALEMTLQELRKNREFSQEQLAEILGIGQDSVSKLENRPDVKLSTLASYVKALGGTLRILADFPGSNSVQLAGILAAQK